MEPDFVSIAQQESYKIGHPTAFVTKKLWLLEEE